ncbi:ankyrin [Macroventuria anomochaeta]|uniref:Ankyrin n=1 Tax=Macroventuria anomochaeta TaxID=301207 RepID=A0ACB6S0E5_9PLEO|nr:ankyrin [Macroventuria anomochaeta]KAF2626982.1 ankyrin [Macroventuria anomochaeta]
MTKFLLERGADPNALSGYNEFPIHLTLFHADKTKHREGVLDALLADARTILTIRDYQNEHPLHCVEYGKSGSVRMVKRLVSEGASPFKRNLKQQNALHLASRAGDHDAVIVLLSLEVEPASMDNEGLNALHHATRSGNHETISVLLETAVATKPSLVASKDTWSRISLHHLLSTTSRVRNETLQLLLDKGVDGSELDAFGKSPLASYFKGHWLGLNFDICQFLLSVKGSSSYVDKNGQNLGHLYASTLDRRVQTLELMREYSVDLAKKDAQSRTILHCAAISGSINEESLHYLLYVVGVEMNAEDESGKAALQHAVEMASKDHDSRIHDPGRWNRTTRLLSESGVSQAASRAIVG